MSWATHVLQWPVQREATPRGEANPAKPASVQTGWLQFASTKAELLVIANQHVAVNTFPGLVHTARQTMKVGNTRSLWANRKEAAAEGGFDDWG